ncbi:MAG: hypothetical protein RJA98_1221 [Pseudomonadota bacterium]
MYENKSSPLLSRPQFVRRVLLHLLLSQLLVAVSLGMGMAGYMHFEGLVAIDAFLNAAMLLGGMGPVDALHTAAGKLFAGFYALYAGLVFIVTLGLVLTPMVHRLLHTLHVDDADD